MEKKKEKSLSLDDIITELHKFVMKTKMGDQERMFIVKRMCEIEHRLA